MIVLGGTGEIPLHGGAANRALIVSRKQSAVSLRVRSDVTVMRRVGDIEKAVAKIESRTLRHVDGLTR